MYYYQQPYMFYRPMHLNRQNVIQGQATWTEGGPVTECNIPWSDNLYMTVAVGPNAGYRCGQSIKVRNPRNGREIIVQVVDTVEGFPRNRINLHRRAFEALGENLETGVINVEITPEPELEEEMFSLYLLEIIQVAYPNYNVIDYSFVEREQLNMNLIKESYRYIIRSVNEEITILASVVYNSATDRVVSFNLEELE